MISIGSKFERRMRSLVRQEVRSSDVLWREYLPRRRMARWDKAGAVTLIVITALGCPMMAACFSLPFLGIGIFVEEGPHAGQGNGDLLPLAFQAITTAGWLAGIVFGLRRALYRSRDLALLAYFPLPDQRHLRRQIVEVACASVLIVLTMGCVVLAYLAWQSDLNWGRWIVATALVALQMVVFTSTAIVAVVYLRPRLSEAIVLLGVVVPLVAGGPMASLGGVMLLPFERPIAWPVSALLPTGWVNGAFRYGLLAGQPAGWLFLAPAFAVVAMAIKWLRQPRYAIQEFSSLDESETVAVLEAGSPLPPKWSRLFESARRTSRSDIEPVDVDESLDMELSAQLALADGQFLAPRAWPRRDWVERFVLSRLSERQRTIVEFRCGETARWTTAWFVSQFAFFIAIPIAIVAVQPEPAIAFTITAAIAFATFNIPREPHPAPVKFNALYAYFPVGFRELSVTLMKAAIWRIVVTLPPGLTFSLIAAWLSGVPVATVATHVAAAVLVVVAGNAFVFLLVVSGSTNDTVRWYVFLLWSLALIIIGPITLATFLLPARWALFAAAVAAIAAGVFWTFYAWLFERGGIDIDR